MIANQIHEIHEKTGKPETTRKTPTQKSGARIKSSRAASLSLAFALSYCFLALRAMAFRSHVFALRPSATRLPFLS